MISRESANSKGGNGPITRESNMLVTRVSSSLSPRSVLLRGRGKPIIGSSAILSNNVWEAGCEVYKK